MCRLPNRRGAVEPLNLDYDSLSGVDRAGLEPARDLPSVSRYQRNVAHILIFSLGSKGYTMLEVLPRLLL